MKHEFKVGDYAISVETHWLGKIRAIQTRTTIIDHDMAPIEETMAEMIGVDTLVMSLTGRPPGECLASNDIQWFATDDLIPYTYPHRKPEAANA